MTISTKKLASLFLAALPVVSFAHEGHGAYHGDDIRHYWYSTEHAIPVITLVLILAVILFKMVQLIRKNHHATLASKQDK